MQAVSVWSDGTVLLLHICSPFHCQRQQIVRESKPNTNGWMVQQRERKEEEEEQAILSEILS